MGQTASVEKTAPVVPADEISEYDGSGSYWTSDGTAESTIRYAAKGIASADGSPALTLVELFKIACKKNGQNPAMRVERPGGITPPLEGRSAPPALPVDEWTCW